MIFTDDISTPEQMRAVFANKISEIDNFIYPLNEFTAHHISKKNVSFLRSSLEELSSEDLTVSFYKNKISELTDSQRHEALVYMATLGVLPDQTAYVYLNSKNAFKALFKDFIPSAFEALNSYLLTNNLIHQIGSGAGTAVLLMPAIFNCSFQDFSPSSPFDYSLVINSMISEIDNLRQDRSCLKSEIERQNSIIQDLNNQINQMQRNAVITSQMTWH